MSRTTYIKLNKQWNRWIGPYQRKGWKRNTKEEIEKWEARPWLQKLIEFYLNNHPTPAYIQKQNIRYIMTLLTFSNTTKANLVLERFQNTTNLVLPSISYIKMAPKSLFYHSMTTLSILTILMQKKEKHHLRTSWCNNISRTKSKWSKNLSMTKIKKLLSSKTQIKLTYSTKLSKPSSTLLPLPSPYFESSSCRTEPGTA